ncbi:hypothetical protein CXB51_018356 [Gossypium anomalum]|uniref:Uncharacterized protein n=1 Tax=Gossypium anomalum TaxID=47600 RepID=A0A8J6CYI1_9ROSI|nr:hypothetical protein CXB51_018356 [Gossypium anomalum]
MDGLNIARRRGIKQMMVKSDRLVAVNTLNGQTEEVRSSLVRIVREQLARGCNIKALLRDLVASQHPENEGKRPKPRLQSMNQRRVPLFPFCIYVGFGSVTDVGTNVAIVAGVGAHDGAKWGSRREGQLLCC